ncbi:MAG TPA: VWA domain-containing protein [Rhodocyclaceae bacterium]|nr:VWA domain-containing protein [Rhodocyclaceae bacterium]
MELPSTSMTTLLANFHFLRPLWLLALLPLAALLWQIGRQRLVSRSWQSVVDARLLSHLLIGEDTHRGPWSFGALALGGVLGIFALAGPAWQKLEQPVFRQQSALVVLLDLSRSMDAADIKPSRLQRAELKLRDILEQRKEGDTALVVYAATPFVVSPLSSDAKAIASQIGSLTTDLMPAQGSRPDRAIAMAQQLLTQAGATQGGVLLITGRVDGAPAGAVKDAITHLTAAGHALSIMGVGTPEGAPIPDSNGGFIKDRDGSMVLPRLDDGALEALARQGHGSYRRLAIDDSDFHALLAPFENVLDEKASKKVEGLNSDQWRDEGPWLLLPLLLLGALAFRRGYMVVMLVFFLLPMPRPAQAFEWSSLWQRDDQRAQQALKEKDAKKAARLFHDPQWRAAANYRAGDYQAALDGLKGIDSADAAYNRGNALAQMSQYQEAIAAYDDALKRQPDFPDAKHNKELVEKLLQQQQKDPKQNQKQNDGKNQSSSQSSSADNKGASSSAQSSGGQGQSSAQSSGSHSASDSQQGKQSSAQSSEQASSAGASQGASQGAQRSSASSGDNHSRDMNQAHSQSTQSAQSSAGKQEATAGDQKPPQMNRADEQWLRRIPDDPGGLWRRKFLYQYKKQEQTQGSEERPW